MLTSNWLGPRPPVWAVVLKQKRHRPSYRPLLLGRKHWQAVPSLLENSSAASLESTLDVSPRPPLQPLLLL